MALWLVCCSSLCLKPSPWLVEKARRDLGWLPDCCHQRKLAGFTLAELLISLAILGVIATFTIPKILTNQANSQNTAKVKEAASMLTGALIAAQQAGTLSGSTKNSDLTAYMNYVKYDTTGSVIDGYPTVASVTCNSSNPCVRLHSGAVIWMDQRSFGGTATTNMVQWIVDPNGIQDITTVADGEGKAVPLALYYNGQLTTRGQVKTGSCDSGACMGPSSSLDPSWFSW